MRTDTVARCATRDGCRVGQCSLLNSWRAVVSVLIMKKKLRTKKLVLSKLTIKKLTVNQIADAKGGAGVPRTSRRPDCGCA